MFSPFIRRSLLKQTVLKLRAFRASTCSSKPAPRLFGQGSTNSARSPPTKGCSDLSRLLPSSFSDLPFPGSCPTSSFSRCWLKPCFFCLPVPGFCGRSCASLTKSGPCFLAQMTSDNVNTNVVNPHSALVHQKASCPTLFPPLVFSKHVLVHGGPPLLSERRHCSYLRFWLAFFSSFSLTPRHKHRQTAHLEALVSGQPRPTDERFKGNAPS